MIKTSRLLLRNWKAEDKEPFAQLNSDPIAMQYMGKIMDRAESDALLTRLQNNLDQQGFGLWAAEIIDTSSFIGFIGLSIPTFESSFTPCVEIGWRLLPDYWNKGFATEGAEAVLHFAFGKLKLNEVVSFTTVTNAPSRRVMEKIGMSHIRTDDFDHPNLSKDHPLRPHVLYRMRNPL